MTTTMDGGIYPEHLVNQMNSQKQIMEQFYNNDKLTIPTGKQGKSSLEMLRLSCEQLQAKAPASMRHVPEQKTVETISSAYDKMSEIDAFNILKKKILKDTTHCHLWMFLFDILLDSNKSNVATWEDQKGMFRIRDPTRLAEMWGEKRNRTNMTYEKLSRSLRHYYEKKILRKVPKRKYTYKFNSREILKSYEVQPFYRRSTSNTQAQRNAAAQANQAQLAAYQTSPSSGQCSPYTTITPSPSYHQHHAGFNWSPVQAFPQSWPMGIEAAQMCHQQPSPAYPVPTSMAATGKQWGQPMHFGFQYRQVDQQVMHSPMTAPAAMNHYNHGMMQASPTHSAGQSYQDNRSFMTELQASETPVAVPEEKPNLNHIMENIDSIIGKSKSATRTNSLPAITTTSSTTYSAAQNALYNQNNSNSNQISQTRCRSHSVNSYESSSPDSYYSNDVMFNDIMESLVMEAF